MRWARGTVLIVVVLFSIPLYSQSDQEWALRNGELAKVFLKGCDKLTTTAVDFDGSGNSYRVEWWRCGPKNPNPKRGFFPVHYVVIQPPNGRSPVLGITLSNSGSSDEYFIDQLELIGLPSSSRQLLLVSGRYYQAQQGTIDCLVEYVADQLQCSPSSESRYSVQRHLRPHEKSFLRMLDEYFPP
jgi:hypothetical protein